MSSYLVASYRAEIPDAASIQEATLEGQLAGEYEELAHYPPRTPAAPDGPQPQQVDSKNLGSSPKNVHDKNPGTSPKNPDSLVKPPSPTSPKPKATLIRDGDALVATLQQPQRLRKLRLVFNEFAGTAVTVQRVTIKDDQGQVIVPVQADFSSGKKSQVLQIAPGDRIQVTYEDALGVGGPKLLATHLKATFCNGSILLANEAIADRSSGGRNRSYFPARRCRVGDQLVAIVSDHDADTSDQRDTVDVTVTTSAGEKLVLKALETDPRGNTALDNHAGTFLATLKIGDRTGKGQIKVVPGDKITVSYLDRENTDPGVPIERTYSVMEAGDGAVEGLVYRTSIKQIEDKSGRAHAKRDHVKATHERTAVILKDRVVARHPDYQPDGEPVPKAKKDEEIVVAMNAPLLFQVTCPKNALNSASVMYVTAVAESEMKAAALEGKKPLTLRVPLSIVPIQKLAAAKGYTIVLQSPEKQSPEQMLQDGVFSGIVRLQAGKRGEPVSDMVSREDDSLGLAVARDMDARGSNQRIPTLLVAGGDVVYLQYEDPQTKHTTRWKVRLLADGRLELMDSTFTAQNDLIHLGGRFYLRVVDPDRDRSDARDTIEVRAKATSGDQALLTLTETLPHSGVFETSLQPELLGEKGADGKLPPVPVKKTDQLYVTFGDDVTFTYDDPACVSPPGTMTVTRVGHIAKGADADLVVFSKQFNDPEMAVKTQFLTAEALFEMAKEHRKLGEKKKADEEIARGKAILEEAIRDYPKTSLADQGDYLLANLAQELGNLQEAIGRYVHVISAYPDSEYAAAVAVQKGPLL